MTRLAPKHTLLGLILFCSLSVQAQSSDSILYLKGIKELPFLEEKGFAVSLALQPTAHVLATCNSPFWNETFSVGAITSGDYGKGKMLMLASEKYLSPTGLADSNVARLVRNIVQSACGGRKPEIALYGTLPGLKAFLQKSFPYRVIDEKLTPQTDLVFVNKELKDTAFMERFVSKGGTLVFASPSDSLYITQKINRKIDKVLIKAGISESYMTAWSTDTSRSILSLSVPAYLDYTALLQSIASGDFPNRFKGDWEHYISVLVLSQSLELCEDSSQGVKMLMATLMIDPAKPILPTIYHPLYKSQWKPYLACEVQAGYIAKQIRKGDPIKYIDSSAAYFPGLVPDSAQRIDTSEEVEVHTGGYGLSEPDMPFFRLQSTGLYVPAGQPVFVFFPAFSTTLPLKIQVGAHDDDLTQQDYLVRQMYALTKTFDVCGGEVTVYSPYGGLLYIGVPDTAHITALPIHVQNVVRAPYYRVGKTSLTEWMALRNAPGPTAELISDKLILTVPSQRIRHLENPDQLMAFWDEVMDADADLAHIAHQRKHPERILIDMEAPFGALCTFPNMIYAPNDDNCALMLNAEMMREQGSWGHFHELGHRHQFRWIDFPELTEVSVNLYSMYVYDTVLHMGIYNHPDIASKEAVHRQIKKYIASGPTLEKFGSQPFNALGMYIELIENFGWQPIMTVYQHYRELPVADYPKNEDEKRDLWFTQICAATGKDLSTFFAVWNIPVSEAVRKKAGIYPPWMPEELKEFVR